MRFSNTQIRCRQLQSRSVLSLSHHLPSSTAFYFPLRTYTARRSYESKPKVALQNSQPTSVALNPPSTTRPPPLSLPEKLPSLPNYKYYFRLGKAYGIFYKNGLKAIWTNYKLARALPNRIFSSNQAVVSQAVRDGGLSRADFQLIQRTKRDINKLPLFILIWLVCGEFTPLVVIFFTSAVPRVIWIPKQVQKAQEEAENRRAKARMETSPFSAGPPPRPDLDSMPEQYQRGVLKFYAKSLDLYPDWWDRWVPTLMSTSLITKRVYRRLEELEVDDFAIARCGGVGKMEAEEIQMACQERGMDTLRKEEKELRRELEQWIERRLAGERNENADKKIKNPIESRR